MVLTKGCARCIASVCFWAYFTCLPGWSFAQDNSRIVLANLKQDLELITREVNSLRSEVEMLRRENAQLRVVVDQAQRSSSQSDSQGNIHYLELQNKVRALEISFRQSERDRSSMQEELNKKFQQIVEQMNRGFEQVASVQSSTAKATAPNFSSDYPKNGFVHKVGKGETVSSIAQKYSSKVSWIINANQITDPTKVNVGRELFVPQK